MDEVETHGGPDADARPANLGEFIASQRRAAELSLRQLAERAGISNPYVSQIERGLRRPSEQVLASLAEALQVSAGTLYSYAGITPEDEARPTSVAGAIRNDPRLTTPQKRALIEVYLAFVDAAPLGGPPPLLGASGGQRLTLPALRQEVQTLSRFGVTPASPTSALTRWMLGFQRRLVRRCECEMLCPKPGPLPQTSQLAATVNLLK